MRVALIVNPAARAGAHTGAATNTAERLRAHGVQTSILSGGSAAESSALLRTAIEVGVDAVVVAGGVTRTIDLARVTRGDGSTRYFGSVLASGFDSKVNDRANAMRWPRGGSRYSIAILVQFLTLAGIPYEVDLELADGTREEMRGDLVMATVGNGRTYGGGIPICPEADPADGLLDVVLVRPAGRLRLLRLLPRVYQGTHASVAEVSMRRVRSVRLSSPGVTAYADGDPIGALPLTVDVAPGALTIFTPVG
ncbi:diacylglycerol kinase [Microbacterium sp. LWH7-1.2]|uniref:diacylglycerol kinase n=1 Tax=Microbacterium sp. LWH7-1.2 TaxID=3135257 RepID=UPI003138ACB3